MTIVRFKTALKSPLYCALVNAAVTHLTNIGRCSFAKILKDANLGVLDKKEVRWKLVKRMIEDTMHVELIPMAEAFFRSHTIEDEILYPSKYMAQGTGKNTEGWTVVTDKNGHLVDLKLGYKRKTTVGAAEAANRSYEAAQKAGVTASPVTAADRLEIDHFRQQIAAPIPDNDNNAA